MKFYQRNALSVVLVSVVLVMIGASFGLTDTGRNGMNWMATPCGKRAESEIFTGDNYISHVRVLAADVMEGRGLGTRGIDRASGYIAGSLAASGFEPGGTDGYFQCFEAWTREGVNHDGTKRPVGLEGEASKKVELCNVVGIIRAKIQTGKYLVIGAHYDHLGIKTIPGSATPVVFNGADDNASGVAGLLLVARAISECRDLLRTNVVVVSFSGEENGLLGSDYFVKHLPCSPDSVVGMVNMDMIGRLREGRVVVAGAESGDGLEDMIVRAVRGLPIKPVFDKSGMYSGSDSDSFIFGGIPAVHFFTDVHPEYNTPRDDVELINGEGGAQVALLAYRLSSMIAISGKKLVFTEGAIRPRPAGPSGRKVYTGAIPMFGAKPVKGVRVRGAVHGSPAEAAGLKEGDIIVGVNDSPVTSLAEYSVILAKYEPGDKIRLNLLRDGKHIELSLILAQRPDE